MKEYTPTPVSGQPPNEQKQTEEAVIDGYVYVLGAGPFVKVGRTKRPNDRLKTLKIQLPFPVEVEAIIPCENHVRAEQHLHWLMKRERANGEWFDLSDDPYMLPMLKDIDWIEYEPENGIYCDELILHEREDAI